MILKHEEMPLLINANVWPIYRHGDWKDVESIISCGSVNLIRPLLFLSIFAEGLRRTTRTTFALAQHRSSVFVVFARPVVLNTLCQTPTARIQLLCRRAHDVLPSQVS